jgi:hypothetical protein
VLLTNLMNSRRLMALPVPGPSRAEIYSKSKKGMCLRRAKADLGSCPLWVKSGHRALKSYRDVGWR